MIRLRYYVMPRDGQWFVHNIAEFRGPFSTQQEAIHYARIRARPLFNEGVAARVVIEGADGLFHVERPADDEPVFSIN